jgi:hypothetical protein
MCGIGVSVDETGQVFHPPVASCETMKKNAAPPQAADSRGQPAGERPCCRFFGIGHTMYKGVYLPSKEEYVAHGYQAESFDRAMTQWKRSIDATGRP